jgi:hypothetical protein
LHLIDKNQTVLKRRGKKGGRERKQKKEKKEIGKKNRNEKRKDV